MTDKVQKIREEVERLQNELIQEREKGFGSDVDDACILELQNVLTYIDSLQKEPTLVYVVTRSEEHDDYVEIVFFDKNKANKYCDQFKGDEDEYARYITKVEVTL